jgi:hypothetical protein
VKSTWLDEFSAPQLLSLVFAAVVLTLYRLLDDDDGPALDPPRLWLTLGSLAIGVGCVLWHLVGRWVRAHG